MTAIPDLAGLSILILEEDPASLDEAVRALKEFGADVRLAEGAREFLLMLGVGHFDVVIASLESADKDFFRAAEEYKRKHPEALFYIVSGKEYRSVAPSSEAVNAVIDDYLQKPIDPARLGRMVETGLGRPPTGSTSLTAVEPLVAKVKPYFIFRSATMRKALSNLPEIAGSGQTVLISGETGTGKEIVARAVHVLSGRASGPFVPLNCGAIPESLIEGELFGHERGAFTGAVKTRRGKFESASGGTLFLDEIGDMPLNLQVRLLRVLEEGRVYRVGGETSVPIDVRVIAATAIDLRKMVEDGLFREDLYYRLNVLRLHLPPLRERADDIPLLALHFLERALGEMGRRPPYPALSSETIYLLERMPWRGNVRELRNVMTRIATLLPPHTQRIYPFHIISNYEDARQPERRAVLDADNNGVFIGVGTHLAEAEDLIIQETLKAVGGNRTKAARLLGISLRNLRRKLNTK